MLNRFNSRHGSPRNMTIAALVAASFSVLALAEPQWSPGRMTDEDPIINAAIDPDRITQVVRWSSDDSQATPPFLGWVEFEEAAGRGIGRAEAAAVFEIRTAERPTE
jgi:hypothetical protein